MENVICWAAGFFLAYLILRGISRLGGALVLALLLPVAARADGLLYFKNLGGPSAINFYYTPPGGTLTAGPLVQPGLQSGLTVQNYGTWYCEGRISGNTIGSGSVTVVNGATVTFSLYSQGQNQYVWQRFVTNNLAWDTAILVVANDTNGVPYATNSFTVAAHSVGEVNLQGTNNWGSITLYEPGTRFNDYMWQNGGTVYPSTNIIYSAPTVITSYNETPQNPISGTGFTPTSTNVIQQSVDNTAAILKALGQLGGIMQGQSSLLATNQGGGGGSSTNVHDAINRQELKAIQTNQLAQQKSLDSLSGTNFEFTGVLSNSLQALQNAGFDAMSNILEGSIGSNLTQWSSDLAGQGSTYGQGAGTMADGDEGPLTVKFGPNNEHTFSLDLRKMTGGGLGAAVKAMADKVLYGMTYLRRWLIVLVEFVLWWSIYTQVRERINMLSVPAGLLSPKPIEWKGFLGSLTFGLLLMTAITTLIMTLPTQAAVFTSGFYINPGTAHQMPLGGPVADLQATGIDGPGGAMTATGLAWWDVFTMVFPADIVFAALANYLAFLLWGDRVVDFCFAGLRAFRLFRAAGLVFLLWGTVNTEASQVALWNATTNTLVISNDVEMLTFPPGQWEGNLAEGGWSCGGLNWEFPASEWVRSNVRFAWDSTGTNIVASVNGSRTPAASFLMGHSTGWAVFGILWAVQLVRKGLRSGAGRGIE